MKRLPKEILAGWVGSGADEFLCVHDSGQAALQTLQEDKAILGRYVLKEEIQVSSHVEIKIKKKGK